MTLLEQFEKYYIPEPNTGCWLWVGSRNEGEYGQINLCGQPTLAHRAAWKLYRCRPVNIHGWFVLHKCDTPPCVNPAHLYRGTAADNMRDAIERGRVSWGEKYIHSKLTKEQVILIKLSPDTHKKIGAKYGINPSTVSRIKSGQRWRYLNADICV